MALLLCSVPIRRYWLAYITGEKIKLSIKYEDFYKLVAKIKFGMHMTSSVRQTSGGQSHWANVRTHYISFHNVPGFTGGDDQRVWTDVTWLEAVLWLRRLMVDVSTRRARFDCRPVHLVYWWEKRHWESPLSACVGFPSSVPFYLSCIRILFNYDDCTSGVHKETEPFFNLLLYLQLNQTCLLQSTPLHSWYTAFNFFSSSGTRPGTCFAGWREGSLSNFLLSPLPSEIGDLLVRILTSGARKSPQRPNLESRVVGGQVVSCFVKNSRIRSDAWAGALTWCSIQVSSVHASDLFLRTASLKRYMYILNYRLHKSNMFCIPWRHIWGAKIQV